MTTNEEILRSGLRVLLDGIRTHDARLRISRKHVIRRRGLQFLLKEREINEELRALAKVAVELAMILEEAEKVETVQEAKP